MLRTDAIGGEPLEILPDRAIHWPRRRTVFVADTHFGKAAAFRLLGSPAPEGATERDLARLGAILDATGAERLVVLGDLLHARASRGVETAERVCAWRAARRGLQVELVRGNHDRAAGDPPREWGIAVHDDLIDPPFVCAHEPGTADEGTVLCGHLHPGVRLEGRGDALRAPCLWLSRGVAVLPAFGGFTGLRVIRPSPGDRVWAFGPGAVVEAPLGRSERAGARRG